MFEFTSRLYANTVKFILVYIFAQDIEKLKEGREAFTLEWDKLIIIIGHFLI